MNPNMLQYFTSTASGSYQTVGTLVPPINSWHYFAIVVSGNIVNPQLVIYLDSNSESPSLSSLSSTPDITVPIYIGADAAQLNHENFNGAISNVQVYNTALSTSEIQGLYAEGIGGAPTRLQNLMGWWPLNGNANDYSGNGNNGAPTNVVFTSTWTK